MVAAGAGVAALFIEPLGGLIMAAIDGLASLFFLAGGIVRIPSVLNILRLNPSYPCPRPSLYMIPTILTSVQLIRIRLDNRGHASWYFLFQHLR